MSLSLQPERAALKFFIAPIEIANLDGRRKPRNDESLRRTDNSIFANWRHKEVQRPTKRALFFLLYLFLRSTEIRPKSTGDSNKPLLAR